MVRIPPQWVRSGCRISAASRRQQIPERRERVQPLPGGDRDRGLRRDVAEPRRLVGRHRFLEPARREPLEIAREGRRLCRGEPAVHLDEQLDVGSDRVPHGLDERDRSEVLVALEFSRARPERVELHGAVSARDDAARGGRELVRRASDLIPAVRVGLDALAARAAEQAVDRLAHRLPDEVPTGHLKHRERRHLRRARHLEVVPRDAQDESLDVKWIAAQHVAAHGGFEVGGDRFLAVDRPRFADPLQPVVRAHARDDEVPPRRAHDVDLDVGDLHSGPPGAACRFPTVLNCGGTSRTRPWSASTHPWTRPRRRGCGSRQRTRAQPSAQSCTATRPRPPSSRRPVA